MAIFLRPLTLLGILGLLVTTLANANGEETSQKTEGSASRMSLEACVARALKKNFSLQIQSYSTEQAKETLTIADAAYSPILSASLERSGTNTYASDSESEASHARLGVSQKISTGAIVSLSSALNRTSSNYFAPGSLNPANNADLSLSISQPLLKDAGKTVNRAAINRAKIGLEKADLDYKASLLQVIASVESAYYNLCFAVNQKSVRELSLSLAETLHKESLSRKQVGVATDLDVLQAEVGVANARRSLILAEKSLRDYEDSLLELIGQFEFEIDLGTVSFPNFSEELPNLANSYKLARENTPEFLSAEASIRQSEIDTKTAKQNQLPTLDLGASLGYNTREASGSKAYRELLGSDGTAWQVDLTYSMPWGQKAEKARYRSSLHTLNQARTQIQRIEQALLVDVRAAVRSVETNFQSVEISRKATELSFRKYELEKARFDAGLSTARRVLEAQDDLEVARIAELQAMVALRLAFSSLRRLEGSSLARYNIQTQQ